MNTTIDLTRKRTGRWHLWTPAVAVLGLFCHLSIAEAADRHLTCSAEPTDDLIRFGDLITCEIDPGSDQD